MLTLDKYKSANEPSVRRYSIRLGVMFALLILFTLAMFPLEWLFKNSDGYAVWYVQNVGGPKSAALLILAGGIGSGLLLGGILWLMGRADRRDPRLQCPHCHRRLAPIITLTGKCSHCGRDALAGPWIDQAGNLGLPTVDEFKAARWKVTKSTLIGLVWVFGASFLYAGIVLMLLIFLGDRLVAWIAPRWDDREARSILALALLPAIAILFCGLLILNRRQRNSPRDQRLTCPRCGAKLDEQHHVIATRKCAKCDAWVLQDPEVPFVPDRPVARLLDLAVFRRTTSTYSAVTLALLVFYVAVFAAIGIGLIALEKQLKERWGKGAADAFFICMIVVALIIPGLLVGVAERFCCRKLRQQCPHCRKTVGFPHSTAMAAHRCPHCGRGIFAEAEGNNVQHSPA